MISRMLTKISNLARQIERTNLEFLDSKIMDRAAILNITTGPEKQEQANAAKETQAAEQPEQQKEANAANDTETEQQPEKENEADAANDTETAENLEQQNEANRQTTDSAITPSGLFSLYNGGMFHTLGIFYTLCLQTTDHLGLVRGPDPLGADPFDWAASFSELFNERLGYSKP